MWTVWTVWSVWCFVATSYLRGIQAVPRTSYIQLQLPTLPPKGRLYRPETGRRARVSKPACSSSPWRDLGKILFESGNPSNFHPNVESTSRHRPPTPTPHLPPLHPSSTSQDLIVSARVLIVNPTAFDPRLTDASACFGAHAVVRIFPS